MKLEIQSCSSGAVGLGKPCASLLTFCICITFSGGDGKRFGGGWVGGGLIGIWQALTERERSLEGLGPPALPGSHHALALNQSRRRRKGYVWPGAVRRAKALGLQLLSGALTWCTSNSPHSGS